MKVDFDYQIPGSDIVVGVKGCYEYERGDWWGPEYEQFWPDTITHKGRDVSLDAILRLIQINYDWDFQTLYEHLLNEACESLIP